MVPRILSVHVKNLLVAVPICKIAVRNYTPSLISALDPLGHHAVICKCVCVGGGVITHHNKLRGM